MSSQSKSPAANPNVISDSNYTGSVVRKAFLAEALANLFTIPLITNTRFTLSLLLNNPSDINPFYLSKNGGRDAALSKNVAMGSIACLVPPLMWRLYVLLVKPELLGRYNEEKSGADGTSRGKYGTITSQD
ncbi:uncharacterized protein K460DRAFT_420590 [Cucurbitaria berberidis CBS 394.84]|uniref:Uncharacterized protein n=1 Tax=Cucurbitaria berberidis CBS 394.84 TaxID=1168544 RepID=A0A9P4G7Y2_9PLEO|nr:uncharacterized protein K460DRAFT_420590 [Cucurbitaria berberidis CBS 394.84]KAF1840708.1 hypothetical protein K460DRAFT_420590 [Cucurbitaria berberidis CBS 394.84]